MLRARHGCQQGGLHVGRADAVDQATTGIVASSSHSLGLRFCLRHLGVRITRAPT